MPIEPSPKSAGRVISERHARMAADRIRNLVRAEGRRLTPMERGLLDALAGAVTAPVKNRTPTTSTEGEKNFPSIGAAVTFQTPGRLGLSPWRPGVVKGYQQTAKGAWIIISELGAAAGIVVRTRAKLIRLA